MFMIGSVLHNLTQMAKGGSLEPVFGRDKELFELAQAISQPSNDPVLLVGETGVGRTRVVEALASALVVGQLKDMVSRCTVFELDFAGLMAQGRDVRIRTEELVRMLQLELPNIFYIDGAEPIMDPVSAGRGPSGKPQAGPVDAGKVTAAISLLRSWIEQRESKFIGAITPASYEELLAGDPSLRRQFAVVRVEPMTEETAYDVLTKIRPRLEQIHGVEISDNALRAAISFSQEYIPDEYLPGKAINVLDRACARYRLKRIAQEGGTSAFTEESRLRTTEKVAARDVRRAVSALTEIDPSELDVEEAEEWARTLVAKLERHVMGQHEAIYQAAAFMQEVRIRPKTSRKIAGALLFAGPPGVGKTLLAERLGRALVGLKGPFWALDLGVASDARAPDRLLVPPQAPGQPGPGGLAAVAAHPGRFKVVVLDNIGKAHSTVLRLLETLLKSRRVQGPDGAMHDFRNCFFIFATCLDPRLYRPGTGTGQSPDLMKSVSEQLGASFVALFDAVIFLRPFQKDDVRSLIRASIGRLLPRLKLQKIRIRVSDDAYEFIARHGYSPERGAQDLERTVEEQVIDPLNDLIADNRFSPGDKVGVRAEENRLAFHRVEPSDK